MGPCNGHPREDSPLTWSLRIDTLPLTLAGIGGALRTMKLKGGRQPLVLDRPTDAHPLQRGVSLL
jgi:hypothetical protein